MHPQEKFSGFALRGRRGSDTSVNPPSWTSRVKHILTFGLSSFSLPLSLRIYLDEKHWEVWVNSKRKSLYVVKVRLAKNRFTVSYLNYGTFTLNLFLIYPCHCEYIWMKSTERSGLIAKKARDVIKVWQAKSNFADLHLRKRIWIRIRPL